MNLFKKIFVSVRYPETAFGKTLQRTVPIVLLVIILILGLSGFATYRILFPPRLAETIDPSSFLLQNYISLSFPSREGTPIEGWFIPSVRGAPVIFLCHGYRSNRSELLTLASNFQENGYPLFIFDFRGHGTSTFHITTLGDKEALDLLSAVEMITARPDVDPSRVGVWGVSLGAYVALSAAVSSDKIKALVLDSPFESPGSFIEFQTTAVMGVNNFLFKKLAHFGLFLLSAPRVHRNEELLKSLAVLEGREKLFITSEEAPGLETQTLNVFNHSPRPKDLLRLKHSKTSILYDVERKNYENTVVEFFKKHLPVRNLRQIDR